MIFMLSMAGNNSCSTSTSIEIQVDKIHQVHMAMDKKFTFRLIFCIRLDRTHLAGKVSKPC